MPRKHSSWGFKPVNGSWKNQNPLHGDTGDGGGFTRHSETVYSTHKEADKYQYYVRFKAENIKAEFDKMTMGQK